MNEATIRRTKSGSSGFTVLIGSSYIGSAVNYSTAELILLIVGCSPEELSRIHEGFPEERRMDWIYDR